MVRHIIFSLSVLSLALLQACGGGGDSDDHAAPAASSLTAPPAAGPAPAGIGSVSARFVPNKSSRYILLSLNAQSVGTAEESQQADSGAMLRLGSTSLSGDHHTVDIAGDAHFALGRWVNGTVTQSAETLRTSTLTGKEQESYHYIAYNRLAELPPSGQLQCTTVAATAPTALSDAPAKVGTASGTASVSFDTSGAAIQGSIQVSAGAEKASVNLSTHIEDAASMSITGLLLGPGPGAGMVLADQGSEVPALVVAYRAQLPGGALYNGVARFACNKT